ncbi:NAD(P)-binding domain-containing protein [Paenibacillus sp. NPDC057967]|uniref:NAD(P)-binding domain-containing protein n=1 Tax=Paenibacillus sp. NPDC057967 TaxID=3346293 RepID=UPI0036D939CB
MIRWYFIITNRGELAANQVVVTTGPFQQPFLPEFHNGLFPDIEQLYKSAYRNPDQLFGKKILVVGAGNSGAQIALELARTKHVFLSASHDSVFP